MLYIYQFSNESGSKELVILLDYEMSSQEIEDSTPPETELSQVVRCDILSGDELRIMY